MNEHSGSVPFCCRRALLCFLVTLAFHSHATGENNVREPLNLHSEPGTLLLVSKWEAAARNISPETRDGCKILQHLPARFDAVLEASGPVVHACSI